MRMITRRVLLAAAGASAAATATSPLAGAALGQTAYPTRPVRLIVPAPAGSRHGVSARLFADSLAKVLGQPVETINPDGSSAYGFSLIGQAGTDGYTIGYATVDLAILHWRGLTNAKPADFSPIALLNEDPAGIHVRADSPWQTARQLLDHIKANPGKLKASSTPAGGIWHLSTVSWLGASGLDGSALPWVPSPGPAAAIEDMVLGGADVVVCSTPEVRATPQAKSIRTLAVMARNRIPRFGDVPTLQQATGTAHVAGAWRGLIGPNGLDPAAGAVFAAAARKAWDSPEFQSIMKRRGFVPSWAGNKEFAQLMEASSSRFGTTLKAAGIVKA